MKRKCCFLALQAYFALDSEPNRFPCERLSTGLVKFARKQNKSNVSNLLHHHFHCGLRQWFFPLWLTNEHPMSDASPEGECMRGFLFTWTQVAREFPHDTIVYISAMGEFIITEYLRCDDTFPVATDDDVFYCCCLQSQKCFFEDALPFDFSTLSVAPRLHNKHLVLLLCFLFLLSLN